MLGKLIKYDLWADWKKYTIIYASTLMLSIAVYFLERDMSAVQNNAFLFFLDHIVSAAFILMTAAAVVMVFVFAVMRFYKNIMRDEGYLMHTLPVHTWQLIASKLITVYIWFFAAIIVMIISTGILMGEPFWVFKLMGNYSRFIQEFSELYGESAEFGMTFLKYCFLSLLMSPFYFMSHTYFSLALGNLASSRKLGISVLMFFAVHIAEQIIATVIMSVNAAGLIISEQVTDAQMLSFLNRSMLEAIIMSTVLSLGMLVAAERIFAKRLNLE